MKVLFKILLENIKTLFIFILFLPVVIFSQQSFIANDYFNLGNDYFDRKNFNAAIEAYTQAIQLNPYFGAAYGNRGLSYLRIRNYEYALADLNQAIYINPNDENAYINRGNINFETNDYEIEDYEYALRINPNNSIVRVALELARQKKELQIMNMVLEENN